jgi:hypothetical protein
MRDTHGTEARVRASVLPARLSESAYPGCTGSEPRLRGGYPWSLGLTDLAGPIGKES